MQLAMEEYVHRRSYSASPAPNGPSANSLLGVKDPVGVGAVFGTVLPFTLATILECFVTDVVELASPISIPARRH